MIRSIEPFVVRQELDRPFSFSQWSYRDRAACLVRVTDEDGVFGWGEGYGPATVIKAAVEWLRPHAIGQDPLANGRVWQSLYLRCSDYARGGPLAAALSAIDLALWDLKGKRLGQPVHALLGGKRRPSVQVYATGLYFTEGADLAERLAREASGYAGQGFRALKMKVGHSPAQDVRNVRAVRQAIGPDCALMIDANHGCNLAEATALADATEDCALGWFEEPLAPDDLAGYAELRRRVKVPIAAGECEALAPAFQRLLAGRCVDVVQPDLCSAGGLTEGQRIAALARAHQVDVAPHCWGTGIAFAAALHFVATLDPLPGRLLMPDPLLEMDRTENPLRDRLTSPAFTPRDGRVAVPDAPGLGVEVDPELLRAFAP